MFGAFGFFVYFCRLMRYADIILPVPLEGFFTYSVPDGMEVIVGMRVLVTFGRGKTYLGIVACLHDNKPLGYQVKPISQVMDTEPVITDCQLKLWQWIADYYMSPIGEVYKAALPSGLKAEDGYRPRTELYIQLSPKFRSEQALHVAMDMLQRAPKQLKAFLDYLALSEWDQLGQADTQFEITRDELLNQGHTLQSVNALVQRGLLETYEKEVGRLNFGGDPHPENIKPLSTAQQEAFNQIQFSFLKKNVTLLHSAAWCHFEW